MGSGKTDLRVRLRRSCSELAERPEFSEASNGFRGRRHDRTSERLFNLARPNSRKVHESSIRWTWHLIGKLSGKPQASNKQVAFGVRQCGGCGNFPWRAERSFYRKPQACVFALTALSDPSMPNAHACGLRLNDFSLPKTFAAPRRPARFDPLEAGCWATLLLECGNSFPLSLPSGRHREDNFPMTKPKRGDKESGDESPHSKDRSTTRTRSGRNSRESIRCPTRSSIFIATR